MAKAYIQSLQNRDGDAVYPVTKAEAVYIQKTDSDGVITQQTLDKKLESMETSFQAGVDTIVAALTELGVTPESTTPAGIAAAIKTMYNDRYTAGQNSVTVSCTISGRTATAKTSTGKTATAQAALGTNNGTLTATLTPTGNNTATKAYAAGWYNAGTITANGATSYKAGRYGATLDYNGESLFVNEVKYDNGDACFKGRGQLRYYNIKLSNGVITLSGTERIYAADCDGHSITKEFEVSQSWNIDA